MKRTGGGTFDPADGHIHFAASAANTEQKRAAVIRTGSAHLLSALNEMNERIEKELVSLSNAGRKIFIDSGVFSVAMKHAAKFKLSHDEALRIPVEQLEGFEPLCQKYVSAMKRIGDKVWGYVEIDLGGREQKRKTRARLEAEGLAPIPVYHPLNDGYEYFDELATQYDRVCVGNIVQADPRTRLRILHTVSTRARKYQKLWVHLLGYTPDENLLSMPLNSCDSSTWLGITTWGMQKEKACLKTFSQLEDKFSYQRGNKESYTTGYSVGLMATQAYERIMRQHTASLAQAGAL